MSRGRPETLDRLLAGRAPGELTVEQLQAAGLANAPGLDAVLDAAARAMYDDPATGAALARLALDGAALAGHPGAAPRAIYLLAQFAVNAGELGEALQQLDIAKAGFDALGERRLSLRTNLGRTHVLNELGRHEEALAASRAIIEALAPEELEHDVAAIELLAAAQQNSGLCFEQLGRYEDVLISYGRAEELYRRAGSERPRAEVAFDRALVLITLGRHGEALAALDSAAATFRAGGFRVRLGSTLTQMADVHLQRGELRACLARLDEAREELSAVDSPVDHHARALVAGRAYVALHLLPEALATFGDAVRFLAGTDLVIEQARAQWALGLALTGLHRSGEAVEAFERALDRFRRSGHAGWIAAVLADLAKALAAHGDVDAAAERGREALVVADANGLDVAAVHARLVLAALSDDHQAASLGTEALAGARQLGLSPLLGAAHHTLGRLLLRSDRLAEAAPHLHTAVGLVEQLRRGVAEDALVRRFLDDKRLPFEDLVTLHLRCGRLDEAMAVAERSKSLAFSELLAGRSRSHDAVTGDGDHHTVLADLRATQLELFGPAGIDGARRHALVHRLDDLEQRASLLTLRRSERAARDTGAARDAQEGDHQPRRYHQPQRDRRPQRDRQRGDATCGDGTRGDRTPELRPGWAISYLCGQTIQAFARGPDGEVVTTPAPIDRREVELLVERLDTHLARLAMGGGRLARHMGQHTAATGAVLRRLQELLVGPLLDRVAGDGEGPVPLVIVPDGSLHCVPFHALAHGPSPLLERFDVSYAPYLDGADGPPPAHAGVRGRTLVVGVGDDLAPLVEDEVGEVAGLVDDPIVLVGREATWSNVVDALPEAGHVHLAGHAVFRPDNPMHSALRLADRWVTATDLLDVDLLGADVVLSACGTARTSTSSAEVLGFGRALLGAGARSAITSLWAADDAATRAFMRAWYSNRADRGPVGALRVAQRTVAADWPHPYHWAPWVRLARYQAD